MLESRGSSNSLRLKFPIWLIAICFVSDFVCALLCRINKCKSIPVFLYRISLISTAIKANPDAVNKLVLCSHFASRCLCFFLWSGEESGAQINIHTCERRLWKLLGNCTSFWTVSFWFLPGLSDADSLRLIMLDFFWGFRDEISFTPRKEKKVDAIL